jgi:hypothetical protein
LAQHLGRNGTLSLSVTELYRAGGHRGPRSRIPAMVRALGVVFVAYSIVIALCRAATRPRPLAMSQPNSIDCATVGAAVAH